MTQASGANARVAFVEESTWGTTPGSPAMQLLKAALPGVGLVPNVAALSSNALNSLRAVENARAGDVDVRGPIPIELPLLGIGTILKHALGPVTTGPAVTQGAGLTGITAKQAETGSAAGAGTLTLSGTDLTWAENGDTAGSAVDVSSAGYYTVESNNGQHVIVYSDGSPSGTSATATVSSTDYTHIIKRGALPAGMTIELGYTDIAQYQSFSGCKINQLGLTIPETGLVTGNADIIGKQPAAMTSSPLDASLTEPTHIPFAELDSSFEENGAAIATVTNFTCNIGNNLLAQRVVGSAYIASLIEGKGSANGQLSVLFENETLINKVLAETASSIKATFTQAAGSIEILVPNLKYFGQAGQGIQTDQGLILPLEWTGLYDSIEETDVKVTITNTEATI